MYIKEFEMLTSNQYRSDSLKIQPSETLLVCLYLLQRVGIAYPM